MHHAGTGTVQLTQIIEYSENPGGEGELFGDVDDVAVFELVGYADAFAFVG